MCDFNKMDDSATSTPEDSRESEELKCSCGYTAKLWVSRTPRNPYRLFYSCPIGRFSEQCGFFQWYDEPALTGHKHTDEVNLIRNACIRLEKELEDERAARYREKRELTSELSQVKAELETLKKTKRQADESVHDLLRNACIRLEKELEDERAARYRVKRELTSELSQVLETLKKIKRQADESVHDLPDAADDSNNQCEFFRWYDEPALSGDRDIDEINLIHNECIRIEEKLELESAARNREKSELISKLSNVEAELEIFKKTKRQVNESQAMPPVYDFT